MTIETRNRCVGASRISLLLRSLLDSSTLCAIATVTSRGRAYANTAYFAWSPAFDLYWLSHPCATHSRNIQSNSSAAICVYDSTQSWGRSDRGVQLFGTARALQSAAALEAERVYATRFPAFAAGEMPAYRFYRFRPRLTKLFDERALGSGVFVTARINRGALAWSRTEVYRSGMEDRS
jgi:uncharacterized protein YhbP (UPF0306 family)